MIDVRHRIGSLYTQRKYRFVDYPDGIDGIDNHDMGYIDFFTPDGVSPKIVSVVDGHELEAESRNLQSTTSITLYYDVVTQGNKPIPEIDDPHLTWDVDGFEDVDVYIDDVDAKAATRMDLPDISGSVTLTIRFHPPTVETFTASDIRPDSATLYGRLNSDSMLPCDVGFRYWKTADPGQTTELWRGGYHTEQIFSETISVDADTAYSYCALAANTQGPAQGSVYTFQTPPIPPPSREGILNLEYEIRQVSSGTSLPLVPTLAVVHEDSQDVETGIDVKDEVYLPAGLNYEPKIVSLIPDDNEAYQLSEDFRPLNDTNSVHVELSLIGSRSTFKTLNSWYPELRFSMDQEKHFRLAGESRYDFAGPEGIGHPDGIVDHTELRHFSDQYLQGVSVRQ